MVCRDCGEEFRSTPGKPGYINQCRNCAVDVPLVGGNMIYEHKTAPYIEIKPSVDAKAFAKASRRFGFGVTVAISQSREAAARQQICAVLGVSPFSA